MVIFHLGKSSFRNEEKERRKRRRNDVAVVNYGNLQQQEEERQQQPQPRLPLELQLDILSWLPTKSVQRLRSVCKDWNSETQHHDFTHRHLSNSRRSTTSSSSSFIAFSQLPTKRRTRSIVGYEMDSFVLRKETRELSVVCACNGLLCLSADLPDGDCAYLYNPLTHRCFRLPSLRGGGATDVATACYSTSDVWGFGFDPRKKEYKVVVLVNGRKHPVKGFARGLAVCTVPVDGDPGPWRRVGDGGELLLLPHTMYPDAGAQVNGRLHRCMFDADRKRQRMFPTIVSFDLGDERLRKVPTERLGLRYSMRAFFPPGVVELQGRLSLVEKSYELGSIRIWSMEEYGDEESWILKFSCGFPFNDPRYCDPHQPLYCCWRDERLFVCFKKEIFSYDPKARKGHNTTRASLLQRDLLLYNNDHINRHSAFGSVDTVMPFAGSLVSFKAALF